MRAFSKKAFSLCAVLIFSLSDFALSLTLETPPSLSALAALESSDSAVHAGIYDNSRAGVEPPALVVGRQAPGSAPQSVRASGLPAAAIPDIDRPLSSDELGALFEFLPPYRPEAPRAGFIQATWNAGNSVLDLRGDAFAQATLQRMQQSATGRRVLRELAEEAGRRGVRVGVQAQNWNTPIIPRGDMQMIGGMLGRAAHDGRQYSYNSALSSLRDREAALNLAAAVMAHELHHIVWRFRAERSVSGYGEVLNRDYGNEHSARLIGYLVAAELGGARPHQWMGDLNRIAENPTAYFSNLKLIHPYYAASLDQNERRDPLGAYAARARALSERRERLLRQRNSGHPAFVRRLEHFGSQHRMASQLVNLREFGVEHGRALSEEIAEIDESIRAVADMRRRLESDRNELARNPRADNLLSRLHRSSSDPAFAQMAERMRQDEAALIGVLSGRRFPEPGAVLGQLTRAQFDALRCEHAEGRPIS